MANSELIPKMGSGGLPIPVLERKIETADMVAYAGATWDWHRMHYDLTYANGAGFDGLIVDGQVFGALLAECIQDWIGPKAFITNLTFRFKVPVMAGQKVRCGGHSTMSNEGVIDCELIVDVVNEVGEVLATAATGSAKVQIR